ncbi:hypothetical protein KCG44_09850 [Pacificimonas sp. WHA3]|uniref:Glutamine amidotransferase domain-containing protein n=1 Tax=Pacificimonas pallii TaxID=2827236 RepID=A0ABS6SF98_9SPHN|nr:hypothetical protein [Pacificimonas pallii]MBV7257084.1 hypothetical protein [Pacificimonas pallii]
MTFLPLLPVWALGLIAAIALPALTLMAARSPRTLWPRLVIAVLFAIILLNPVSQRDVREASDDIALILHDRSDSMTIGARNAQAETAIARLQEASDGVEWRVVAVPQDPQEATRLGTALEEALSGIPAGRLGAAVIVSDGVSGDEPPPGILPAGVPLHMLIAGDPDLTDRRLIVERVPPYTVAGERAELTIRVDDPDSANVDIDVRTTDGMTRRLNIAANEPVPLPITVERRGPLDIALSVAPAPGEASLVNNRALARLNGVTDRLSVLLVSGTPYPGGRVWRDLFKADPNVDLVHFTILRLPSSFDMTPPEDLALIPFPVDELFQERLDDFDLIIFDRFTLTSLMSPAYFDNLADRVRGGSGLLVVAGAEFSGRDSVAFTSLRQILPAAPGGTDLTQRYRPALTDLGRRHPVTRTLGEGRPGAEWGNWGMIAGLSQLSGDTLMQEPEGRPLLLLDRVDEGRVGLIASTDTWWWARAVDGEGPRDELLRRTAHWLMQEPDLNEEQLRVSGGARSLTIDSESVRNIGDAAITGPDGELSTTPLAPSALGAGASVEAAEAGLYQVEAGGMRRFALVGNTAELAEIRPRAAPFAAAAQASGGGVWWLREGIPDIRRVDGKALSGSDWAGVARRGGGALIAVETDPVIPRWTALMALIAAFAFAWWREHH